VYITEHEGKVLPEPTGLLSKSVPMKAIELANGKVANVTPHNNRARPYLMLMSAQRYKVGKRVAEHSVIASINFTRGGMRSLLA